jgi:hypothetical protein
LIVEDDPPSRAFYSTRRTRGFKALVASRGAAGIALAQEYMPHAITSSDCRT